MTGELQILIEEEVKLKGLLADNKSRQRLILVNDFRKSTGFDIGDYVLFREKEGTVINFESRLNSGIPFMLVQFLRKKSQLYKWHMKEVSKINQLKHKE